MTTKIIRDILKNDCLAERSVVAIGTFDGVHLGHQQILSTAVEIARERNATSVALTFDPHPTEVLAPPGPGRLASELLKNYLIARTGAEVITVLPFNQVVAAWTAEHFVENILEQRLRASVVVVGFNFSFGNSGDGTPEVLERLGHKHGFSVVVVPPVELEGIVISSSSIRRYLRTSKAWEARRLLGRSYSVRGEVVAGQGRGLALGFPTANVEVEDSRCLLPARGVYAGAVLVDGKRLEGLVYFGSRPTFDDEGADTLEVHIIDWHSGSLLDKELTVIFERWLRADRVFPDGAALAEQLQKDLVLIQDSLQEVAKGRSFR